MNHKRNDPRKERLKQLIAKNAAGNQEQKKTSLLPLPLHVPVPPSTKTVSSGVTSATTSGVTSATTSGVTSTTTSGVTSATTSATTSLPTSSSNNNSRVVESRRNQVHKLFMGKQKEQKTSTTLPIKTTSTSNTVLVDSRKDRVQKMINDHAKGRPTPVVPTVAAAAPTLSHLATDPTHHAIVAPATPHKVVGTSHQNVVDAPTVRVKVHT